MLNAYTDMAVFLGAGILFLAVSLLLSRLLRPHHPDKEKLSTYECGKTPFGEARVRFKVRYYIFALVFLVFDVEVLFLYPWAVALRDLGWIAWAEATVFLALLFGGLLYAWRKKVLEWL
ncbi:MAG TPA: NAD(P)H-quinone oxidoreductase subunit 3 [Firmicutes bacterium]|nr:NAD(P)H-quinone oxidoreductase subunit 3 [Bacillota bacterium]